MLRTTSNSLFAKTTTAWRRPALYSSVKSYTTANNSTPATPAAATTEKKKDNSLSARLGGSGRGKVISDGGAATSDPFASFLANAKKPRTQNNNNDRRNGSFTPRPRKQQQGDNKGQFADAATTEGGAAAAAGQDNRKPRQPRPQRTEGGNISNRSRSQQQGQRKTEASTTTAEGGAQQQGQNSKRQPRTDNNSNNRNRTNSAEGVNDRAQQPRRRMNLNRAQQPQEVRTRRATTFIDKDIDWSSLTLEETSSVANENAEQQPEDAGLLLKDVQGDYNRFLSVGSDIKWSQMVNGANVGTLVGSNPTFDLSQKTAFLAALSSATGGQPAARK